MTIRSVSVCICTLDRPDLLTVTLQSLAVADRPAAVDLQVIVVDNSPRGSSRGVVSRFREQLPIEYGHLPELGLSRARNYALALSRGDLLLWTDDDVIVSPGWIRCYVDCARKYPDAPFYGGPILPRFVGEPPPWLVAGLPVVSDAFALRDAREDGEVVQDGQLPFGANFCVRRLAMTSGFDEELGWKGRAGVAGEETALFRELAERYGPGRWASGALVEHVIPAERQTLAYLRRYYSKRGAARRDDPDVDRATRLLGRPRFAYRAVLRAAIRFLRLRVSSAPADWLAAWRDLWVAVGLLEGVGGAPAQGPRTNRRNRASY